MTCEQGLLRLLWGGGGGLKLECYGTAYALIISPFTNIDSPARNLFYNYHRIDVVRTMKYLGIILDNQLLFKQHIKMLESKLSGYVGILFKLKSFLPKYILSKIYYAFIHSYLNYGQIIWGATSASNLSKLCRIQIKLYV